MPTSCPLTNCFQYFSNKPLFLGIGEGTLLGITDAGSKGLMHDHIHNAPRKHQVCVMQFNNIIIATSKSNLWVSISSFCCFWIDILEIFILQSISRNRLSDPIWDEHKFHNTGSLPHGGNPVFSPALNNGCLLLFEAWNKQRCLFWNWDVDWFSTVPPWRY